MLLLQLHLRWLSLTPWALCPTQAHPERHINWWHFPSIAQLDPSSWPLQVLFSVFFYGHLYPVSLSLEGYIATEFQVAFHWVSRLLNFVVTHTQPSNTTQFFFILITHRPQNQPQQLGCTALYTIAPTLEPLECTTARSQQLPLPNTSEVSTWLNETFGRDSLW